MAFRGGGVVPHSSFTTRSAVPARPLGTRNWGVGVGWGAGNGFWWRRNRFFYPYTYGYVYPYGYLGYPYIGYPYYDSGYYSSSYSDQNSDYNAQQTAQLNAEIGSLNQQMQDLRDQNDNLRDYIERSDAAAGARYGAPAPDANVPDSLKQPIQNQAPVVPTTLFFKDGHTVDIHNYAVVGNTLWALSENRSVKYPLADIDIDKTTQENEKHGVEFAVPQQK